MSAELRLIAVGSLLALFAVAPAVAAGDPEALIQQGIELRREGKDFQALDYFKRANELAPTPRSFAQLGLVEQALGRWVAAEEHLTTALRAETDEWVRANHGVLVESVRVVRSHITTVELRGEPDGAAITVNGAAVGTVPLPGPLRLGEGDAEIVLEAPGHESATRSLSRRGGHPQ